MPSGQSPLEFVCVVVEILAEIGVDGLTRISALLFVWVHRNKKALPELATRFGEETSELVNTVLELMRLHEVALQKAKTTTNPAVELETVRKMLLAMAGDIRVVLIRLASRLATLRYFSLSKQYDELSARYGRETLDIYAPLANRLGIWQLKWQLEDLGFRFTSPDTYKQIATMLEDKRSGREHFIEHTIVQLEAVLEETPHQISGRPKHIYSIYNKMRKKGLSFANLYDVHAVRVIVADVKTCYEVLGIVHDRWTPIAKEFDDYISHPKPNGYQSLHTVVVLENGRSVEIQIRTQDMHRFAEYGIAAHWRYKEGKAAVAPLQGQKSKLAWVKQLLAWQEDVNETVHANELAQKALTQNQNIYVLTPEAKIIELPIGATPIDFAYRLHTDLGHQCRGARVDGNLVPLNTILRNGQTVEIMSARSSAHGTAGPSRDWLNPGYLATSRARLKVRAWFNVLERSETLAHGRQILEKILQRNGKTAINWQDLANQLHFEKSDDLLLALGKDELAARQVELALTEPTHVTASMPDAIELSTAKANVLQHASSDILVVGTSGLLTQFAQCCKPTFGDVIVGFITRGKGVSIHRNRCTNLIQLRHRFPERIVPVSWGSVHQDALYKTDVMIVAQQRADLLADISHLLSREKLAVTNVNMNTNSSQMYVQMTLEVTSSERLQQVMALLSRLESVQIVNRC